MKNIGTVNYRSQTPPRGYHCQDCDAFGVKLWRMSNSSCIEFRCFTCAKADQKAEVTPAPNGGGVIAMEHGREIQAYNIGNMVPAIPCEEGNTCWSYGQIPVEAVLWWDSLPFFPKKLVTLYLFPGQNVLLNCDNALIDIIALHGEGHIPQATGAGEIIPKPGEYNIDADGNVTGCPRKEDE